MLTIPWLHFRVLANYDAHSTSRYLKTVCEMQQHPQQITKNGRALDSWMDTMFIPYMGFGVIISIVSKEARTTSIVLQLVISLNAHVRTSPKCCHELWGEKENGCTRNTYTMCSYLFTKWILRTTSSFMLQHTHTTKSRAFLSLLVWLHTSSHVN